MEITLKRLPKWLETQIRNLNPRSYDEMAEAIVRHLDQRPNGKDRPRQETPSALYLWGKAQTNWEENVLNGVVVNRWPGTVLRLSTYDVVAEGTCGMIATLKWRAPILDKLCQYLPINQTGPERYTWLAEQCWLC